MLHIEAFYFYRQIFNRYSDKGININIMTAKIMFT